MMQSGRAVGPWVLVMVLTLHAARLGRAQQSSSTLDRLERLMREQQAQLMDQQALMEKYCQQWEKERGVLRQEIRDLKAAVKVHEQDAKFSDHSSDNQRLKTSVHTQQARSDDGGPLEVVVNRLAQDLTQLTGKVQAVSGNLQTLKTSVAGKGSTFVRWGSSTCSSSSQLVYTGVLGGAGYGYAGAAANQLCLTKSPRLQNIPSGVSVFQYLYGTEYETTDSHFNEDAVCALCWSPLSSTMMVPGTTDCPGGWTVQYSGYLMAGLFSQTGASEFICVDTKKESRLGSRDNHDGHRLYYTVAFCGSLPCAPYENSKIVTCVVCSK